MKATPLQQVKERFGDKKKLIASVEKLAKGDLWIDRVNDAKGLARASNTKLLRLHDTLESLKKDFGTRAKLIDAIRKLEKREKDTGLLTRLEKYPAARLLDLHRASARRRKRADAKAKAAPAKKPAKKKTAKKAPAKKS